MNYVIDRKIIVIWKNEYTGAHKISSRSFFNVFCSFLFSFFLMCALRIIKRKKLFSHTVTMITNNFANALYFRFFFCLEASVFLCPSTSLLT